MSHHLGRALVYAYVRPMRRLIIFGQRPTTPVARAASRTEAPDWVQADPRHIERALERALERSSGGWYVVDATRSIGEGPRSYRILGRDWVAWRSGGRAHVAPAACPHLGADLGTGCVRSGKLVCPWHGLALGPEGHGAWKPRRTFDDGVLTWVRLHDGQDATEAPILATRPSSFVEGTIRAEARCEPADILANRFDPWHGVHFHPHSFASLRVLEATDDVMHLRVTYKVAPLLGMEVDATFHSPEPRTIVMTITSGEGVGSVVETHATPIESGRTVVIETTLATSDRPGFGLAIRATRLLRPLIEKRALRLWIDDVAYAERRYALRQGAKTRGEQALIVLGEKRPKN